MWKVFKVVVAAGIIFALLMVVGSVRTFNWVHALVQNYFGDFLGTDPAVSFLAALGVFAIVCLIRWRTLLFAPVTGKAKPLITLAIASFAGAGALKVMNARLPFNQQGQPTQSWIETSEGRVVLDEPPGGVDRKTGLARQVLTAEVLRSITLEKKAKEKAAGANMYFSASDGKPIRWFAHGTCQAFAFDGYDDLGQKLEPATKEKVEACNKLRAEAEEKSKQLAAAKARRDQREEQAARRKRFQEIGHYIAEGRYVMIDGIKIVFQECVVERHAIQIKFRIANIREEQSAYADKQFDFGLVNSEGVQTRSSSIRRVQGEIGLASNGAVIPPVPGERGWIVVEFPRDYDSGSFGIMINGAVAFNQPASHIVSFRGF